jgi:hypothetical protein
MGTAGRREDHRARLTNHVAGCHLALDQGAGCKYSGRRQGEGKKPKLEPDVGGLLEARQINGAYVPDLGLALPPQHLEVYGAREAACGDREPSRNGF